METMQNIIYLL